MLSTLDLNDYAPSPSKSRPTPTYGHLSHDPYSHDEISTKLFQQPVHRSRPQPPMAFLLPRSPSCLSLPYIQLSTSSPLGFLLISFPLFPQSPALYPSTESTSSFRKTPFLPPGNCSQHSNTKKKRSNIPGILRDAPRTRLEYPS